MRSKIKNFITSILCGSSTFTIIPNTDYKKYIPESPNAISNEAWLQTGEALRLSIYKVGAKIGTGK